MIEDIPSGLGRGYSVTSISTISTAATGGTDIFTLLSTAASQAELLGVRVQQVAAGSTPMTVEVWRASSASTGPAAPGTALTPVNRLGHPQAPAAVSGVTGPSTTPTSTAAQSRLFAGAVETDSGKFEWTPSFPPMLERSGQRLSLRVQQPQAPVVLAATMIFRETGRPPL
jgi:hypothetical protein